MRVKIYRPARARLLEIWDYTEKRWGEGQADNYIRGLIKALEKAQGERYRWRPVSDDKLPNVFFIRYKHHYVFFRELSDKSMGVISILHESMNIPSRLRADSEDAETP